MPNADRERFLEQLEACERISALLLLALESGAPDPLKILDRRKTMLDELVPLLPADLEPTDLARLDALLETGARAKILALQERQRATANLAALQRSLSLAQQLAQPRATVDHRVEISG
jgi:hypothetical protein